MVDMSGYGETTLRDEHVESLVAGIGEAAREFTQRAIALLGEGRLKEAEALGFSRDILEYGKQAIETEGPIRKLTPHQQALEAVKGLGDNIRAISETEALGLSSRVERVQRDSPDLPGR
jgi:hypothetical protein